MNVKGGVSVRGNNIKKYRNGPTGHVQNYRCKTNRVYVTTVSRSLLGRAASNRVRRRNRIVFIT